MNDFKHAFIWLTAVLAMTLALLALVMLPDCCLIGWLTFAKLRRWVEWLLLD